jgi:hypothetical protein
MFNNCRSLKSVNLPTAWATGHTNTALMFQNCYSLSKLVLPSTASNVLTTVSSMFNVAFNIRDLQNTEALGSPVSGSNLGFLSNGAGAYITGSLSFNANIGNINLFGPNATQKVGITGLRLTNTGSLFGGSSPQVGVQQTNLDTPALQTLFTDISNTAASGSVRTINITGTNYINNSVSLNFTSGSASATIFSGFTIPSGSELTVANTVTAMNWTNVTFDTSLDLVIPTGGNNIPNGKVVYFTAIVSSNLVIYKPYYVINSNATNFQVSLTSGGTAIDITSGTSGTLGWAASVVSYNSSGFTITFDTISKATTTNTTATISPLKRIDLLSRGWTVTG